MGASGWEYRVPLGNSAQEAFRRLQEDEIASGDFVWPWTDEYRDSYEVFVERPKTIAELEAAKEDDQFWEGGGTHGILDLEQLVDGSSDVEWGAVRLLTDAELDAAFGTRTPTAEDFARIGGSGFRTVLDPLLGEKWSGRGLVLHDDAGPAELYCFGWSGD